MAFPNKFAGRCEKCGATVAEKAGLCDKKAGKWVVTHNGGCPASATVPVNVNVNRPCWRCGSNCYGDCEANERRRSARRSCGYPGCGTPGNICDECDNVS